MVESIISYIHTDPAVMTEKSEKAISHMYPMHGISPSRIPRRENKNSGMWINNWSNGYLTLISKSLTSKSASTRSLGAWESWDSGDLTDSCGVKSVDDCYM